MQQEAKKKNSKLVWLASGAVALVAVVAVVLGIFLMPGTGTQAPVETGPVGGRADLYWNVDREQFSDLTTGMSNREPGEDGLYHVRFAYNGELVEYTIADKRLVNAIDTMDVVGLVKDESGNVIDAVDPATIATEVAKNVYVQRINANGVLVNSSIAMNGMETDIQYNELTQVYNVDKTAEIPGQIDEAELMDCLLVYANDKGEITHVFITYRQPEGGVYWRIGKKNTTDGKTNRIPDENGVYSLEFAKDGEQVTLKCKDQAIVNEIDDIATRMSNVGLQVDEEGFITATMDTAIALRGKLLGAGYHITGINGNEISCSYMFAGSEAGKSFTFTVNENTKIYNVCYGGTAEYIGAPTELQMEDRIIVYTDLEGNPILVFVILRRVADAKICYNYTRLYDAVAGVTTREPDANGYYVYEVSIDGEHRFVRTRDKNLANLMDKHSARIKGVVLEGDIIKFVCDDQYVAGHYKYLASSQRIVQNQTGMILSFYTAGESTDTAANLVMSPDVGIYDISGRPGTRLGQKTTVKDGDLVRLIADYQNNITHIFVVASYSGDPVYYNLSRQFDSVTNGTKRVADEEGYYSFNMVTGGKQVTVKTKSKDIADFIDRQSPYCCSLEVRDGIIYDANPASSAYKQGYLAANWGYFQRYNGKKSMNCADSGNAGSTRYKLSADVKVYNISAAYESYQGELTTLQEGDRITGIATGNNQEIQEIYVITRQIASEMYYNTSRQYNGTTLETSRVPDENGYYVFDLAVNGEIKQFKTASKELATKLDKETYAVGLKLSGNIIKAVFPATCVKGIQKAVGTKYDVTKINGRNLTIESLCPTNSSQGKSAQLTLASNYKVYNMSSFAENKGAKDSLKVGDRVICYANMDGDIQYVYILTKHTREKGAYSYCEHCDKEVYWQPYEAKCYDEDTHVYLTHSRSWNAVSIDSTKTAVEDRVEMILDLNGKEMRAKNLAFTVYGKLSIVDSVGGGKMIGDVEADGKQALISSGGGIINLYSGTVTRNPESKGLINGGGCIKVGKDSVLNMYGGTVEGGIADMGGNIFSSGGFVNIYGGKITGGTSPDGGNIRISGSATLNMQGGTVDGDLVIVGTTPIVKIGGTAVINKGEKCGLQLSGGMLLSLADITADTKIYVDAAGVFTEQAENIESYKTNFISSEPLLPVDVIDNALAIGVVKECAHCNGEKAIFGKFTASACASSSHLMVLEDMTMDTQALVGSSAAKDVDVVVDLNGHTVTLDKSTGTGSNATGRFALVYGSLSIQDSSEEGTGKIFSDTPDAGNGGMIAVSEGGKLNIYSGELAAGENFMSTKGGIINVAKNAVFTMHNGKLTGGRVGEEAAGGNVSVSGKGTFIMKGGEISGGQAGTGANVCVHNNGIISIEGGSIVGGEVILNGVGCVGTVTGAPVVEDLIIMPSVLITADGLVDGASIGVKAAGVFTKELESEEIANTYITKEYFKSLLEDPITPQGKALACGAAVEPPVGPEEPPVLQGNERYCNHCEQVVEFTEFKGFSEMSNVFREDAHIIFTDVLNVEKQLGIGVNSSSGTDIRDVHVVLELNGKTITVDNTEDSSSTGRLANVYGHLYIQDSSAEQTGKIIGDGDGSNGGLISAAGETQNHGLNGGNVTLYSGELTLSETAKANKGGVIYLTRGKLVMEGGKITGGRVIDGANGGNINMAFSEFIMHGGEISGGTATLGGNIYAEKISVMTIYGGTIGGGTATDLGGNVYMTHGSSTLTLYTDALIGGTAAKGGNVYINNGKVYVNNAAVTGGDIYIEDAYPANEHLYFEGAAKATVTLEAGMTFIMAETNGGLTAGAEILVSAADGVISAANEKAAEYLAAGYIKPADPNKTIDVVENQLVLK